MDGASEEVVNRDSSEAGEMQVLKEGKTPL